MRLWGCKESRINSAVHLRFPLVVDKFSMQHCMSLAFGRGLFLARRGLLLYDGNE